jgi:hypothetical protein
MVKRMTSASERWLGWRDPERLLWFRWVLANGVGEVIGLSLAGVVGVLLLDATAGPHGKLIFAVVLVGVGTLEGVIVGVAQWIVLREPFPVISARQWVGATAVGAFIAWMLGMFPSLLFATDPAAAPTTEPSLLVVLVLAGALGIVGGLVLSAVQWIVLRSHVTRAWRWLPANAFAWAVAMPIVFLSASVPPTGTSRATMALLIFITALVAGLVVGAIHGLMLVKFTQA